MVLLVRFRIKQYCLGLGFVLLILALLQFVLLQFNSGFGRLIFHEARNPLYIESIIVQTRQVENQPTCRIPYLPVNDPEIAKHLKDVSTLQCSKEANWIYTKGGKIYLADRFISKNVKCTYKSLQRVSDEKWEKVDKGELVNGTEIPEDGFLVDCLLRSFISNQTYSNLHAGVRLRPDLIKTRHRKTKEAPLHVYFYLLDSMSRVNFIRKLSEFYKVLTQEMGAVVMEGFNIVGDGTPWTLIPMLTGHFQPELPEGRKRFENATYLDKWPWIWKDFVKAGFVTSETEEQPQFSFTSYKLCGFSQQPTDHYLRGYEFETEAKKYSNKHKNTWNRPYCVGDTPRAVALAHWYKEMREAYRGSRAGTWSLLFSSEISHDDYNLMQANDAHWAKVFREQYRSGLFNDTFLIVMGDHGRRFGPVRATQTGKTEEKLPFLSVIVPQWFQTANPEMANNLHKNAERLVTPFDLYATQMHLLHWSSHQPGQRYGKEGRGISLFDEVPLDRTCSSAAIRPHFCSCLDWKAMEATDPRSISAVDFIIKEFNAILHPDLCAPLTLHRIVWAQELEPSKDLLAFKESIDIDNINPDLSSSTNLTYVIYQFRIEVLPSHGSYEVSVWHYLPPMDRYEVNLQDVSRLDAYGSQPHCIINSHQELRQYCYCKVQL